MQSAISAATRNLPKALPQPPTFRKQNPADIPIMFLAMSSATLKPSEVDEYAETLLARQISTIEGVAQVSVFGSAKYAVRIQADPAALATRQIGIDKLVNAVAAANVNLATGALNGPTRAPPSSIPAASSTMPRNSTTRSSPTRMAARSG